MKSKYFIALILLLPRMVIAFTWSGKYWERDIEHPVFYRIQDEKTYSTSGLPHNWFSHINKAAKKWNETNANFKFTDNRVYIEGDVYKKTFKTDDTIAGTTYTVMPGYPNIIYICETAFNSSCKYPLSIKPSAEQTDVQSAMLHEFGHWLNLKDIYSEDSANVVMYYSLIPGQIKRELTNDDIAGIKYIYPFSAWVSCTTNIPPSLDTPSDYAFEVVTGSSVLFQTGVTNGRAWLWSGTLYDTPEITSLYTGAMCSYPSYGHGDTSDTNGQTEIEPLSNGYVTISVDGNVVYAGSGIHYYRFNISHYYYYNVVEIPFKAILDTIKPFPGIVSINWQTATWPSEMTVGDSTVPIKLVSNYYYPYPGMYQPLMAYCQSNLIEYDPSVLTTTIKKSPSFVTENEVDNYEVALDKIVAFKNYPNPFFDKTELSYVMPENSKTKHVSLKIYNILGQTVKTLVNEIQQTGKHTIIWDKQTDSGNKAQSGIYICRLQMGDYTNTQKVVILK